MTRARGCLSGLASTKVHAELRRQDIETDSPKDTSMVGDMPRRNLVKKCNNLIAPDSATDVLGTHYSTKEHFRRGSGDDRYPRFSFAKPCSPASASVELMCNLQMCRQTLAPMLNILNMKSLEGRLTRKYDYTGGGIEDHSNVSPCHGKCCADGEMDRRTAK